ncbi:MAG: LysR family transcriptional regulator [Alphaproteobacteria bacterium]|nr:LysR family transcriptional regulator [Alphaproteobacteria bacterium]
MDLNLFAVFDAIMRHRSVSLAAQSLGLTQPAASNALTRLRGQLGDQLFVRSKNGMLPTKFATAMAPVIERALADLQGVAQDGPDQGIPLSGLKRNFTFVMSDLEEVLFLSDLVGGLATAAPSVSVEIRPFRSDILQDALEFEQVDFVIAHLTMPFKNLISRPLAKLEFVCVLRPGHPAISADGGMELETYLELGHVLVAPDLGGRRGVIDDHLRTMERRRDVVCSVPHFLSACLLVSSTDHVVTLPRQLAERAAKHYPLRLLELPFPAGNFSIGLHWLSTRDKDREHAALRDFILSNLSA